MSSLAADVARLRQVLDFQDGPTVVAGKQGFVWLSEDDFVGHFAADVDPARARVMYAVQQALAGSAFTDVMAEPAWSPIPARSPT
jgi:hypothetical protein